MARASIYKYNDTLIIKQMFHTHNCHKSKRLKNIHSHCSYEVTLWIIRHSHFEISNLNFVNLMHKLVLAYLSNIKSLEKNTSMTKKYHHLPCASLCC